MCIFGTCYTKMKLSFTAAVNSVSVAPFTWRVVAGTVLAVALYVFMLLAFGRAAQYIAAPGRVYGAGGASDVDIVDETLDAAELRRYQPNGDRSVYTSDGSIDSTKLRASLAGATRYRCPEGYFMRPLEGARWGCTRGSAG